MSGNRRATPTTGTHGPGMERLQLTVQIALPWPSSVRQRLLCDTALDQRSAFVNSQ